MNYTTADYKARLDRISLALMSHLMLTRDGDQQIHDDRYKWMADEAVKYALALMAAQDEYTAVPTEPAPSSGPPAFPHWHNGVVVQRDCTVVA